jgi:antitoxin component YwqK of YwqJK toxin-antitoxin module
MYYPNGKLKAEGIADEKANKLIEKDYDVNGKFLKELKWNLKNLENMSFPVSSHLKNG